ncbi:MAG: hypothetical protein WEB58_09140 [Planctomycetaceae bacterium]
MPTDFIWIELECRQTDKHVRMFRGKASRADFDALVSGTPPTFIRLGECYWYNDAEEPPEEWEEPFGTFERLGKGIFSNFTGEMFVRCDTIVNISVLKDGFEGEPRGL